MLVLGGELDKALSAMSLSSWIYSSLALIYSCNCLIIDSWSRFYFLSISSSSFLFLIFLFAIASLFGVLDCCFRLIISGISAMTVF